MRVVNFCLQYFSCLSIVVLVGGAPMEKAIGEVGTALPCPQTPILHSILKVALSETPIGNLIPPVNSSNQEKKLLVLDLDETLIRSCHPIDRPNPYSASGVQAPTQLWKVPFGKSMQILDVLVRPFLREFIDFVSRFFEIAIWTAGTKSYADPIIDIIDPSRTKIQHRLFREACDMYEKLDGSFLVKDLSRLGRDLKSIVVVDNTPSTYVLNQANALPIETWEGDSGDRQLVHLAYYLSTVIKDLHDVTMTNHNKSVWDPNFASDLACTNLLSIRDPPSLIFGITTCQTEMVRFLLGDIRVNPAANINEAIRVASRSGRSEIVRLLLADDRVDPSAMDNEAIRGASQYGHHEVVQLLAADHRVNPSAKDFYAIKRAFMYVLREVLKVLLDFYVRTTSPFLPYRLYEIALIEKTHNYHPLLHDLMQDLLRQNDDKIKLEGFKSI